MYAVLRIESVRISGPQLVDVQPRSFLKCMPVRSQELREHPQDVAYLFQEMLVIDLMSLQLLLPEAKDLSRLGCKPIQRVRFLICVC